MSWLINKRQVRRFALHVSKEKRAGKFTRVGSDFYSSLHATVRSLIENRVQRHPSIGKTLK